MTTAIPESALIDDVRLLNVDVLTSGSVAAFSSGLIAGRHTIVITLDGAAPVPVGELMAMIGKAEALGLPSIVLASGGLDGVLPRLDAAQLRHVHLLVSPALDAGIAAMLAAAGVLHVLLGPEDSDAGDLPLLKAATAADAVDAACLALGYLPAAVGGRPPVYAAFDRPEVHAIAPAGARNAGALLFDVFDDVLRIWTSESDELLLAVGRVEGRVVAAVAPQPVAGAAVTSASAERFVEFLRLAQRMTLPVVVLGGIQPGGTHQLRTVASVVRDQRVRIVLVQDGATISPLQDVLRSAPGAVEIGAEHGLRAQITRWVT